jgi:hypothetical protein
MKPAIDVHKFNDDLLLAREDRELAARKYPAILHVLDHPEMRHLFAHHDKPANHAKVRARTAGLWAIVLVWIALVIASSEYLLTHSPWAARIFAVVSAVCGLIGVIIGGTGILFAGKKEAWLQGRLMTERIRQFHFQTFVFRLPEILRSLRGEEAKAAFFSERELWFAEFKARFHHKLDEQFIATLGAETQEEIWLHVAKKERDETSEHHELEPVFEAYRELRIMHQIGYANHQLKDDRRIFSAAPRRQAAVFSAFGFTCVILVCVIHLGVLAGVFFRPSVWEANSALASMVIIWIAIAALAVRAIQEGLQPEREVERYEQYRSSVRFVLERFDRASSQSEKLQIMQEMERLVFDEMRNFLIAGNRSRFLI